MQDQNSAFAPTWPLPDPDIREALEAAYADGSWGKYEGRNSENLCDALRQLTGVPHVSLCSSGTIAIELALRGLKVGPGDEVVLAGYDFPGNFRAIEALGAIPMLVDLAPESWRLDLEQLPGAISEKTRAILASHLHGDLLDMPRLCEIAQAHNVGVVEDACQVPGATIASRPAGAWGDVGVFSFGGSKLLTAGRGGALFTVREDIHQRIRIANDRGNLAYPLSELQAAVLVPQIYKLKTRNEARLENVRRFLAHADRFAGLRPLQLNGDNVDAVFYKLPFLLAAPPPPGLSSEMWRGQWIQALQTAGLAFDSGFRGFTRRTSARCRRAGDLVNAQAAAERTLLLHHPLLLQTPEVIEEAARRLAGVCQSLVGA